MILRAEPGAKVWSSGHDIDELPEPRRDPLAYFDALETLLRKIQDCPLPVIAMVGDPEWQRSIGVSLTVVDIVDDPQPWFSVSLIPTTLAETTLGSRAVGDPVNLEVDVIAKYVQRLLGARA